MSDERIVKTTLRLPEALLQRSKIYAVRNRISFQTLVIEALKAYLREGRQ